MVPLYRGIAIFGAQCTCQTTDRPTSTLHTMGGTFGADGVEPDNWQNLRGRVTSIVGTLAGPGPSGLAAAEAQIRSFNDGQAGEFVDSTGSTWHDVQLRSFTPLGRVKQDAGGNYLRAFHAVLLHLS